jgi:sugar O-acyltransferase (sialic acid O-acetyltransferase NeuD family)
MRSGDRVNMVLFGVSNMLGDIYECAKELDKKITRVVLNVPEEKRARTKDFVTRLRELNEAPLITRLEDFAPQEDEEYYIVPVTPRKSELVEFLKKTYQLQFTQLIHPTAYVSRYVKIGEGVFIGARSVVSPGAVLGDHVFIHSGVTVGHDTVLHEYVRLNPGSNIAGHVEIFNAAMIGLGANVIEELVIGRGAVVAAGAVVIRDVEEYTMVAGAPAVVKKFYINQA